MFFWFNMKVYLILSYYYKVVTYRSIQFEFLYVSITNISLNISPTYIHLSTQPNPELHLNAPKTHPVINHIPRISYHCPVWTPANQILSHTSMDRYFAKSMPSTGSFVSRMYCPQLLSFSLLGTFQFHWCVDNRMLHVSLNFVQLCGWFLSVVWLVQWCVSSLLISSSTTVYELYSLDNLMSLWLFVVITVLCEFDLCSDREPDEWIWKFQSVIFISKRHWPLDKLRKGIILLSVKFIPAGPYRYGPFLLFCVTIEEPMSE